MATPTDVLGSRLKREYRDYNAATGTFACTKGSGDATQATSANRPAATTTPSGQSCPEFIQSANPNHDFLGVPALSSLPAYNASHNRLVAYLLWWDGPGPDDYSLVWEEDDWHYLYPNGVLEVGSGIRSNSPLPTGQWTRVIVRKNGTGAAVMTINGVDQTTTGSWALGQTWRTAGAPMGARGNGDYWFDGKLASFLIAWDTSSAFSSGDISALDAALNEYLSAGGSPITVTLAAPRAAELWSSVSAVPAFAATVAAPREEARALSVSAAPSLGAALPAPGAEGNALPLSLVVALTAAMSPSAAEERPGTAVGAPGGLSFGVVGVGSSELVPSSALSLSSLAALAPGAAAEIGLSFSVAPGAVSAALSAVLAEERGGIVTTINGAAPADTVVLLAAPRGEERSASSSAALGPLAAVMPPRAGEGLGGLVSSVQTTVAALWPPRAEERATSIARELAGVVVALSTSPAAEHVPGAPVQALYVVSLNAPRGEERWGTVEATLGPPPPTPTAISRVRHTSTVGRIVRSSGAVSARVVHTSTVGRG